MNKLQPPPINFPSYVNKHIEKNPTVIEENYLDIDENCKKLEYQLQLENEVNDIFYLLKDYTNTMCIPLAENMKIDELFNFLHPNIEKMM